MPAYNITSIKIHNTYMNSDHYPDIGNSQTPAHEQARPAKLIWETASAKAITSNSRLVGKMCTNLFANSTKMKRVQQSYIKSQLKGKRKVQILLGTSPVTFVKCA